MATLVELEGQTVQPLFHGVYCDPQFFGLLPATVLVNTS